MGILQRKDMDQTLVKADILTKLDIDKEKLQTKESLVEAEEEVSGRELVIAAFVIIIFVGVAVWLITRR